MANIPEIVFYQKITEIKQRISEIKLPDYPDIKCAAAIGGVYGIQPIENALTEADRLTYLDKKRFKGGKMTLERMLQGAWRKLFGRSCKAG